MSNCYIRFALLGLAVLPGIGCKQAVPPEQIHDANVRALRDQESQWNDDLASRNPARLLSHYADDAVLIFPGQPASAGLDAIKKSLDRLASDPALSLKIEANKVEVAGSGDLGYAEGTYTLAATDPQTKQLTQDHGSYVTTYRKQADGAWKAVVDIATSEVSPASQVAPAAVQKKK